MNHKAKIGLAVGGIALVAAAICFFSGEEEGEVTAIYAGLASNDARSVSFTISNGFAHEIACSYEIWEPFQDDWQPINGTSYGDIGFVPSRGATNLTVTVPGAGRWRVRLNPVHPLPNNIITDARLKLLEFSSEHNWPNLGGLLLRGYVLKDSDGPEMLGNKPAAAELK